jgi:hypothetical protein
MMDRMHIHVNMHVSVHVHSTDHTLVHVHARVCEFICAYKWTYHECIYTYTSTFTFACHTYIHTHIHTCTTEWFLRDRLMASRHKQDNTYVKARICTPLGNYLHYMCTRTLMHSKKLYLTHIMCHCVESLLDGRTQRLSLSSSA